MPEKPNDFDSSQDKKTCAGLGGAGAGVSAAGTPPAGENGDVPPAPEIQPTSTRQAANLPDHIKNLIAPVHEKAERHAREATAVMWKQITGRPYRS